jgi:hypothetical protein
MSGAGIADVPVYGLMCDVQSPVGHAIQTTRGGLPGEVRTRLFVIGKIRGYSAGFRILDNYGR